MRVEKEKKRKKRNGEGNGQGKFKTKVKMVGEKNYGRRERKREDRRGIGG